MTNIKCRNCLNLRNDWCEKVFDSPDPDRERDCQYFRRMTNGDYIRNQDNEGLASIIAELQSMCLLTQRADSREQVLEYLNREVKE